MRLGRVFWLVSVLLATLLATGCGSDGNIAGIVDSEAFCNGIDDDEDGEIDEDVEGINQECTAGVGACLAKGTLICDAETLETVCTAEAGAPMDELCNGIDDDCDGEVDEDFDTLGTSCMTGVGACETEGIYACDAETGVVVCQAEAVAAGEEACNGIDDDCDGETDEDFAELGDACSVGQGACVAEGQLICSEDGAGTACDAVPGQPGPELCNAIDDNCDGVVDEPFTELGDSCTNGIGECVAEGAFVCADNGFGVVCDAVAGEPAEELCNGLDDDCDDDIDEDFTTLGDECTAGDGECMNTGELICSEDGTGTACNAIAGDYTDEVCDGWDNDCDGEADEDFEELGTACTLTQGGCTSVGTWVCAEDGSGPACDAPAFIAFPELCNGIDDDCDDEIDEAFPKLGTVCTVGLGQCQVEGNFVCSDDGYTVTCDAVAADPTDEICDGIDNDCDGLIDESFPKLGQECSVGVGACQVSGSYICGEDGAGVVCDVTAGDGTDEVCNGIDDDCNGIVDDKDADDDGFKDMNCGGTDCDDDNYDVKPGAQEICGNGIDDDCNGAADDVDADKDGAIAEACGGSDCNDNNPAIQPGAVEVCGNGLDDNCNGEIDDVDADEDGAIAKSCGGPDCNDFDATIGPDVAELCDGIDNNCDGAVDEAFDDLGMACQIGQGECAATGVYVCAGDGKSTVCNAPTIAPKKELCDTLDNDCDGSVDEDFGNLDEACSAGVGECVAQGTYVCALGGLTTSCNAVASQPVPEVCDGLDNDCNGEVDDKDSDFDGYIAEACGGTDCNDNQASLNPGAAEVCDGLDNNCDGVVDDKDTDGDGHIDAICQGGTDCNDGNANVNPDATEICNGIDDDCNGITDNKDSDGDLSVDEACGGADCDDDNAAINPLAVDYCDGIDNNCDGKLDPTADADGDGFLGTLCGGDDCDDTDPSIFPGAPDICDGVDQDCDGNQELDADKDGWRICAGDCNDEDATIHPGAVEVCNDEVDQDCDGDDNNLDADFDGFNDPACGGMDCDDSDASIHPLAKEFCDGIDNNCNGEVDEGGDGDGDGFAGIDCGGEDCDDKNPAIRPNADEICDGIDNNCNGETDEVIDGDGDGFPGVECGGKDCDDTKADINPLQPVDFCDGIDKNCDGKVETDADGDGFLNCEECNDNDAAVYPGAPELCDGKDNNCDTIADDVDADGDGFIALACGGTDCDDSNPLINPAAPDFCNGVDDNCNGIPDDNKDNDGDGYDGLWCGGNDCDDSNPGINPGVWDVACDGIDQDCDGTIEQDSDGDGYWNCAGDCNDNDPAIHPNVPDFCDGVDSDCDGVVDDMPDGDGDGHDGVACGGDDCDDNDAARFAGNEEICDQKDNDCDEEVDEGFNGDVDEDGYFSVDCAGDDCDDENPNVHPDQPEICANGIDDNCNGLVDNGLDFNEASDIDGWTMNGDWGIYAASPQSYQNVSVDFPSPAFGTDGNRSAPYPGGEDETSWARSTPAVIPANLEFWSWHVDEGSQPFDWERIRLSVDGGQSWTTLVDCRHNVHSELPFCDMVLSRAGDDWDFIKVSTGDLGGQVGIIEFYYKTEDGCCDFEQGWFIDDLNFGGEACIGQ